MAQEILNGQAEYGTVHVMEEEMREAGAGVFEAKSGEAGRKKHRVKAVAEKPASKPTPRKAVK